MVHVTNFSVIEGNLYKMGSDKILRHYVLDFERNSILAEAHGGAARGNYAGKETTQKILHARLWWVMLHRDSKAYCRVCHASQRTGRPSQRDDIPLNL